MANKGFQLIADQKDSAKFPVENLWRVESGRLEFFQAAKGWTILPAAEVWTGIFGSEKTVRFESLVTALPNFQFSRFPAELGLTTWGTSPNDIQIDLVGVSGKTWAKLSSPDDDQVFIGNVWHPIQLEDYTEGLAAIKANGISFGNSISVGQLIWLRLNARRLGFLFFDSITPVDPEEVHFPSTMDATEWGLKAELYPYQKDGVHFLKLIADQSLGCILGDEMGLGKTIQVIALMLSEKSNGRGPTLIIAPATLLENWRRELALFSPSLSVKVHAGSSRVGIAARLTGYDAVVTSYDIAVRDEPLFSSIAWNLVALDEAQNIKNPDAQRTIAAKGISRRVSLAVTGTPVENRLLDLWSLSDFALPGLLGKRQDFENLFVDTDSDAMELARFVAPIILRRRVRDVAKDLPERIDVTQPILMSRRMAEMYEKIRQEAILEYGQAASLVVLQRLRMFCSHPDIILPASMEPSFEMPKYQRLIEIMDEIFSRNEKCLLFTSYTKMIDILMNDMPKRFPLQYFNFIDGRVPVQNRLNIVDEFSAASNGMLFLNPRAAGVGLNITAANHVIHYNPEWNPAVEDQASARAYRRKQKRPVTVYQLYFASSVEEVIVNQLRKKRGLAENAATGHSGDATPSEVLQALSISPLSSIGDLE